MSMNKRIAELRREEKDYCEIERCMHGMSSCDDCQFADYKPYSTDIACAMELWEEMAREWHEVTLIRTFRMPDIWITVCLCDDNDLVHEHRGETEAEAIAGAWLKWKGQEKA
jgi:hypothetical protein